jgi:integrase
MNAYLAARNLKDSTYSIYAEYSHYPKVKRITTGIKVNKKYWDNEGKQIKANGAADVKKANDHLKSVLGGLNETVKKLYTNNGNIYPTVDQLNAHLSKTAEAQASAATPETPLTTILSNYLENRTKWSPATRTSFKTLLDNILRYQEAKKKVWLLTTLTNHEIENFQRWILKTYKLANSTLAKRHKLLKHFLNKFPAPLVNQKDNLPLYDQLLQQPQVLDKSDIKAFEALPLEPQSRLGKVRNMTLLQIFTGLRFGDLVRLRPHHVSGEQIIIREEKTIKKNKPRHIPLFPQAAAILALYTNEDGVFELPVISSQKFNKYLLEITSAMPCFQKEVLITEMVQDETRERFEPKYLHITSHTARRTFCTLLLSLGYSVPEVMDFSGHTSLSSFSRYVGKVETRKDIVSDFAQRFAAL